MRRHCRAGGGRAIKNEWWRAGGRKGCMQQCVPLEQSAESVYWMNGRRRPLARPPQCVARCIAAGGPALWACERASERERGRPLVAVGAAGGGCCSTAQTDRRIIFLYSTSFRNSTAASFLCCCFAARPPTRPAAAQQPFALIIYESAWHFISADPPCTLNRRCAPLVPQCALPLCLTPQWRWNFSLLPVTAHPMCKIVFFSAWQLLLEFGNCD